MKHLQYESGCPWELVYANDTDAYNPEVWARESLMILRENMIASSLVHRDFENEIQEEGDVVNTRKPAKFEAKRKTDADVVTVQDASAPNTAVTLDQHVHTSFLLKDGQMSKSFKDLTTEFLEPAVISLAKFVDQVVIGQGAQWILANNQVSGNLDGGSSKASIIETRKEMNSNLAPVLGRSIIHGAESEADLLNIDQVLNADKLGDDGTAMREASLGRLWGFNHWMDQNATLNGNPDNAAGAVNLSAGYAAGTTVMVVDGFSAAITAGSFFRVAGDDTPQRVVSTVGGGTPTSITFVPGLKRAVVNNAVVTVSTPGLVDLVAGYAADYKKEIIYDTFTADPTVGQIVAFKTSTDADLYSILQVDTTAKTILLDRPLEAAIANNDPIHLAPKGSYNLALHKNAIALVIRPLALPTSGTGALASSVSFNDLTMRTVMTYDGNKQGMLITLDFLLGIKVLDKNLGLVMLG